MKFYINHAGGPSPGLELTATKQDLRELSVQLTEAINLMDAEGRDEGVISLPEPQVTPAPGNVAEWIEFRVARDIAPLFSDARKRAKRNFYVYTPLGCGIALVFLYLAFVGLKTVITR